MRHVLVVAAVRPGITNSATREAERLGLVAAAKEEQRRTHTARVCRSLAARPPPSWLARIVRLPSQRWPPAVAYDEAMGDAGSLRAGHAEREQVVLVLRQQYAEGRLSDGELDQRVVRARAARTFADLDHLVADLPVAPPSRELVPLAAPVAHEALGGDPGHRLSLTAGMSAYVRRGVWTVPAYLRLTAGIATLKVDFQHAWCPHPVVDVAVMGGLGSVVLVVPEGWGVNTDRLGKSVGSVSNQVSGVPTPGMPLLVLHGSSGAGSVRVRHPGWNDRRQARKVMSRGSQGGEAPPPVRLPPAAPRAVQGPQDAPAAPSDRP